MTVKSLTDTEKQKIAAYYKTTAFSQRRLAKQFGTSTRTIGRVLEEHGLATPVARLKGEAHQVMKLLAKHGMGFSELKALLSNQMVLPFTGLGESSVQQYLNAVSADQLAKLFYNAGLVKIAEKHNAAVQTATLAFQQKAQATLEFNNKNA